MKLLKQQSLRRDDLQDEFLQYLVKVVEKEVGSLVEVAAGKDINNIITNTREILPGRAFQNLPKGVSPCAKIRAHCVVGGNPTE